MLCPKIKKQTKKQRKNVGNKVYIRQYFFVNSDLKDYFKQIISFAERNKSIVLFELNEIARKDKPHFLAISGFEHFFDQETMNRKQNFQSIRINLEKFINCFNVIKLTLF
jgi:hypothetical protein